MRVGQGKDRKNSRVSSARFTTDKFTDYSIKTKYYCTYTWLYVELSFVFIIAA